jgi:hypothetical protein
MLLQLVTAVVVIRLYRRAGHGIVWALLALIPVGVQPLALPAIANGYVTLVEAEWLLVAISAISPTLLLFLVLKRWPADASASQAEDCD